MSEPLLGTPPPQRTSKERLHSWKEIAAYLGRDVTTAQRWEKREGMPVHRHLHDKRGSVYALSTELDAWLGSRRAGLEDDEKKAEAATVTTTAPGEQPRRALAAGLLWLASPSSVCLPSPTSCPEVARGVLRGPRSSRWPCCL